MTRPRTGKLLASLLFAVLCLFVALPAWAVELRGQIRGTVHDREGDAIPGVVVIVKGPALQGQQGDKTDAEGAFRVIGLPPGEYNIEASKPNFRTWITRGVRVEAGATVSLDIKLILSEAGEEIVVEDKAPVVDVTATRTGAVLTKEMLRDIPNAGRDYQTAISMAPGVVDMGSGNPNVHGGLDSSNQYYVDGVNSTDPLTNTFSMNLNFDAIEEVQVLTGGMDAEYGRSLGGAVNIVTRSGGNKFQGDIQVLYSGKETQLYTPMSFDDPDSSDFSRQSYAINLGGPIIKDKLWYFASVQRNLSTSTIQADVNRPDDAPMLPQEWTSWYLYGKLTWRATSNHHFSVLASADPTNIENANQDPYILPSGEIWWRQGGWLVSASHMWTPGRSTIVETQAFLQQSYIYAFPTQWKDCKEWDQDTGGCKDDFGDSWLPYDADGFGQGPYPFPSINDRHRASIKSSLTQYLELLGTHQFKFGVEGEQLTSYTIYPGLGDGYDLYSYGDGDPQNLDTYVPVMRVKYDSDLESDLVGYLGTVYLQDVYNPIKRLTLRPGVRVDASRLMNDVGELAFTKATFAPRFGAAFDLTNDQRTNLHAYYGRFYDVGFLGVSDVMGKKAQGYTVYTYDAEGAAWNEYYSVASTNLINDDLLPPYSDEWNIGLGRDLGQGWGLDATFVYKAFHRFWDDDEVNLIWNNEGSQVIGYRNGVNEAVYRIRTPDELWNHFTSFEVMATKEFDEHWGAFASYTWSHSYGTSDDQLPTGILDIPEQYKYEKGISSYDIPDQLKIAGSYRNAEVWELGKKASMGYLFGWNFEFQSGTPYRKMYWNDYYQGWSNLGNDAEDPSRLPAYNRVDGKIGLTLKAFRTRWDLTAECFNIFNERTVTSVNTEYDDPTTGAPLVDDDGVLHYGRPTDHQNPRYFQFGLRGEF